MASIDTRYVDTVLSTISDRVLLTQYDLSRCHTTQSLTPS